MKDARTLKLVALGLATAFLGGGIWFAYGGFEHLARERQQAAQLQRELDNAKRILPEVLLREQLVKDIAKVSQQVERMGFDPSQWGERKLRRAKGPISRTEAGKFLRELGHGGSGQIFVADAFDLSTVTPDGSLFHSPLPGDQDLVLEVTGALHFQKIAVSSLTWAKP